MYVHVDIEENGAVLKSDVLGQLDRKDLEDEISKRDGVDPRINAMKRFVDLGSTEEVEELFLLICESYHYDVFKGALDEKA